MSRSDKTDNDFMVYWPNGDTIVHTSTDLAELPIDLAGRIAFTNLVLGLRPCATMTLHKADTRWAPWRLPRIRDGLCVTVGGPQLLPSYLPAGVCSRAMSGPADSAAAPRRNIELKARDLDRQQTLATCRRIGGRDDDNLWQRDTYFAVPCGGLKLREQRP